MDRRTYPVWIDSETDVELLRVGAGHRIQLAVEHGREGDPAIAFVGSVEQVHRLVVEPDSQLTRWRLDRSRSGH